MKPNIRSSTWWDRFSWWLFTVAPASWLYTQTGQYRWLRKLLVRP